MNKQLENLKQLIGYTLFTLIGIVITTSLVIINEHRHDPIPSMYYTCSKDQVNENLYNQPKGFEPALVNHCVLHSY